MFFRIVASIIGLIALAVILDQIQGLKHTQQQQIYDLQRRVYDLEDRSEPEEPNTCPIQETGPWREYYPSYDRDLDEQDFKKRRD